MDILNLVIIGVICIFAIIGAFRGLSGELATILASTLSAVLLWFGAPLLRQTVFYIAPNLPHKESICYIAIAAIILALIAYFTLKMLFQKIVQWAVQQPYDAILGAIFGGAKAYLLISIIAGLISASDGKVDVSTVKKTVISEGVATFWAKCFTSEQGVSIEITASKTND